eukprot:scaffold350216_cov34-Prasinocladus_malaysianus.AAC.1
MDVGVALLMTHPVSFLKRTLLPNPRLSCVFVSAAYRDRIQPMLNSLCSGLSDSDLQHALSVGPYALTYVPHVL